VQCEAQDVTAEVPDVVWYQIRVTGRVQGVGFRVAACREAKQLGLAGWVRNERDGSVSLVAGGDAGALASFVTWLQTGPRGAAVTEVRSKMIAEQPLVEFVIR
jgi:acylphosphatase